MRTKPNIPAILQMTFGTVMVKQTGRVAILIKATGITAYVMEKEKQTYPDEHEKQRLPAGYQ